MTRFLSIAPDLGQVKLVDVCPEYAAALEAYERATPETDAELWAAVTKAARDFRCKVVPIREKANA